MKVFPFLRIVVLSLLLVVMGTPAFAQVGEARRTLALGVSGGLSLNSIGFDPTIKQNRKKGPTFGLVARYTCEKYFSTYCALQVELNYSEMGWDEHVLNSSSQELPDTYVRTQKYLHLPILARLAWGKEERGVMGYFLAGPQIGYCIGESSKQSVFTLNAEGNPDRPNDMYAQYAMPIEKKFDYGITGGIGLEVHTKIGHFLLEGRYYYGLSDIYGNSKKDTFGRSNNSTIIAKISYLIDVWK